jgi:CDP-diacylglycerol--serine O-phosphatidyltransferase
VLPNAVTLAALFAGFYAIVMAMNGRFEAACIAIFCAAVLDSLDGRVARMTNTQSAFGEQMDSLSTWSASAPRRRSSSTSGRSRGWASRGWIAAFVYMRRRGAAAGALQHQHRHRRQALLPGPAQPGRGGLVIGLIWVMDDAGFKNVSQEPWLAWTAFGVTLYAGLSMVTNAPFYSFKVWGGKRTVPFAVIVAIALGIALSTPPADRAVRAVLPLWHVGLRGLCVATRKGSRTSVIATSTDEPDEKGLHP